MASPLLKSLRTSAALLAGTLIPAFAQAANDNADNALHNDQRISFNEDGYHYYEMDGQEYRMSQDGTHEIKENSFERIKRGPREVNRPVVSWNEVSPLPGAPNFVASSDSDISPYDFIEADAYKAAEAHQFLAETVGGDENIANQIDVELNGGVPVDFTGGDQKYVPFSVTIPAEFVADTSLTAFASGDLIIDASSVDWAQIPDVDFAMYSYRPELVAGDNIGVIPVTAETAFGSYTLELVASVDEQEFTTEMSGQVAPAEQGTVLTTTETEIAQETEKNRIRDWRIWPWNWGGGDKAEATLKNDQSLEDSASVNHLDEDEVLSASEDDEPEFVGPPTREEFVERQSADDVETPVETAPEDQIEPLAEDAPEDPVETPVETAPEQPPLADDITDVSNDVDSAPVVEGEAESETDASADEEITVSPEDNDPSGGTISFDAEDAEIEPVLTDCFVFDPAHVRSQFGDWEIIINGGHNMPVEGGTEAIIPVTVTLSEDRIDDTKISVKSHGYTTINSSPSLKSLILGGLYEPADWVRDEFERDAKIYTYGKDLVAGDNEIVVPLYVLSEGDQGFTFTLTNGIDEPVVIKARFEEDCVVTPAAGASNTTIVGGAIDNSGTQPDAVSTPNEEQPEVSEDVADEVADEVAEDAPENEGADISGAASSGIDQQSEGDVTEADAPDESAPEDIQSEADQADEIAELRADIEESGERLEDIKEDQKILSENQDILEENDRILRDAAGRLGSNDTQTANNEAQIESRDQVRLVSEGDDVAASSTNEEKDYSYVIGGREFNLGGVFALNHTYYENPRDADYPAVPFAAGSTLGLDIDTELKNGDTLFYKGGLQFFDEGNENSGSYTRVGPGDQRLGVVFDDDNQDDVTYTVSAFYDPRYSGPKDPENTFDDASKVPEYLSTYGTSHNAATASSLGSTAGVTIERQSKFEGGDLTLTGEAFTGAGNVGDHWHENVTKTGADLKWGLHAGVEWDNLDAKGHGWRFGADAVYANWGGTAYTEERTEEITKERVVIDEDNYLNNYDDPQISDDGSNYNAGAVNELFNFNSSTPAGNGAFDVEYANGNPGLVQFNYLGDEWVGNFFVNREPIFEDFYEITGIEYYAEQIKTQFNHEAENEFQASVALQYATDVRNIFNRDRDATLTFGGQASVIINHLGINKLDGTAAGVYADYEADVTDKLTLGAGTGFRHNSVFAQDFNAWSVGVRAEYDVNEDLSVFGGYEHTEAWSGDQDISNDMISAGLNWKFGKKHSDPRWDFEKD